MKRRDPEEERDRWRRGFPRRRFWRLAGQSILSSIVAAALGFSVVVALGFVLFGPSSETSAGWTAIEQAQR